MKTNFIAVPIYEQKGLKVLKVFINLSNVISVYESSHNGRPSEITIKFVDGSSMKVYGESRDAVLKAIEGNQ